MIVLHSIEDLDRFRASTVGKSTGFVPTMGNLHRGHLALIKAAKRDNDVVVLSIFINPTQFNQQSDFDSYPKTIEQDLKCADLEGVDAVFMPTQEVMYPDGYRFRMTEADLTSKMEGEFRPGHFDGVLTVVLKLFNLIKPNRAYFGEKDYQQYSLIKKMVDALFLDVQVVGCPTIRDSKGLALSSRNIRLNSEQKLIAHQLNYNMRSKASVAQAQEAIEALGFKVEYMVDHNDRRYAAAFLGEVRLIDNIPLSPELI